MNRYIRFLQDQRIGFSVSTICQGRRQLGIFIKIADLKVTTGDRLFLELIHCEIPAPKDRAKRSSHLQSQKLSDDSLDEASSPIEYEGEKGGGLAFLLGPGRFVNVSRCEILGNRFLPYTTPNSEDTPHTRIHE